MGLYFYKFSYGGDIRFEMALFGARVLNFLRCLVRFLTRFLARFLTRVLGMEKTIHAVYNLTMP